MVGYNTVSALCFAGTALILKINHFRNGINWHSDTSMISLFSALTSLIVVAALSIVNMFFHQNAVSNFEAADVADVMRSSTQIVQISSAGVSLAAGLLVIGSIFQRRPWTRSISIVCLLPLVQLISDLIII